MKSEPEQEFFADGITEDSLTELSRFRELFVISRNSAFFYKEQGSMCRRSLRTLAFSSSSKAAYMRLAVVLRTTAQPSMPKLTAISGPNATTGNSPTSSPSKTEADVVYSFRSCQVEFAAGADHRVQRLTPENREAPIRAPPWQAAPPPVRAERQINGVAIMLERAIALDGGHAHAHAGKDCVLDNRSSMAGAITPMSLMCASDRRIRRWPCHSTKTTATCIAFSPL